MSKKIRIKEEGGDWEDLPEPTEGFIIDKPEPFAWAVYLGQEEFARVRKGVQPNRFYRFLQRMLLGVRWVRL